MTEFTNFCNNAWYLVGGGKEMVVELNLTIPGIIPMKDVTSEVGGFQLWGTRPMTPRTLVALICA